MRYCEFMEKFEAEIVKIAAGDVSNIPQDLLDEEAIIQRIPMSSQESEGVHRQSRLVRMRAPAVPWIPASARVHQNIEWVRSWAEKRIQMRAAAFDFEWKNKDREGTDQCRTKGRTFALGFIARSAGE